MGAQFVDAIEAAGVVVLVLVVLLLRRFAKGELSQEAKTDDKDSGLR